MSASAAPFDRDAFIADSKRTVAAMTEIRDTEPVKALLMADDYSDRWDENYETGTDIEPDPELDHLYVAVSCLHLDIMQVLTAAMEAEYEAALSQRIPAQ
jgi:hypothetical protein